jgi:hypothetical protein
MEGRRNERSSHDATGCRVPSDQREPVLGNRRRSIGHFAVENPHHRDNPLTEELAVPFRVLPSPGPRTAESIVLIASGVLSVVAWILVIALHHPVSVAEPTAATLLFGSVLAAIGLLHVRQQRRYFGFGGRYWLEVNRNQLTVVTPDGQQTYAWHDLTRFVVEKDERTTMDTEKHTVTNVTVYVTAVDAGPNSRRLMIFADDFAAKLPGNNVERAQRFCAILNDLRDWAVGSATISCRDVQLVA